MVVDNGLGTFLVLLIFAGLMKFAEIKKKKKSSAEGTAEQDKKISY